MCQTSNLSPGNFFLWGYSNNPTTLWQLMLNIQQETDSISGETFTKVLQNFCVRLEEYRNRRGRHLDDFENIKLRLIYVTL